VTGKNQAGANARNLHQIPQAAMVVMTNAAMRTRQDHFGGAQAEKKLKKIGGNVSG